MSLLSNAVVRGAEIRKHRSLEIRRAVFISVFQTQILFWAWALGWYLGPVHLLSSEIMVGATFSLALGFLSSWFGLRRYLDRQALARIKVRRDGTRMHAVLYGDHFWLSDEIIVKSEVSSFDFGEDGLKINYHPSDGGEDKQCTITAADKLIGVFNAYFAQADE